jgi:hypothetical protein
LKQWVDFRGRKIAPDCAFYRMETYRQALASEVLMIDNSGTSQMANPVIRH